MHMKPDVVDYASHRTPRPSADLLRYAPLYAAVFSGLGLLQSTRLSLVMYDEHGRDGGEGVSILATVALSVVCLILACARLPRYRCAVGRKLIAVILLCVVVLVCDTIALWNLSRVPTNLRLF